MIIGLYIILIIALFVTAFTKRDTKLVIPILIFSYLFGGHLNTSLYSIAGRLPHELILILAFVLLHLLGVLTKKTHFFKITWGDKVFAFFYIVIYIIPWVINIYDYINDSAVMLVRQFLPVKIWIVYRIFYYIIFDELRRNKNTVNKAFNLMLQSYIFGMLVSGIIGTIRMMKIPVLKEAIDISWPIIYVQAESNWLRMLGTVGGTNGGGILFAISAVATLFLFFRLKKRIYLYLFPVFILFLLLTASFSSTFIFILMLALLFYKSKNVNFKQIIQLSFYSFALASLLLLNGTFRETISKTLENRVERQMGDMEAEGVEEETNYTPSSLAIRIDLWYTYIDFFLEKPIFGYGYRKSEKPTHGRDARASISESYFVETLLYGGIFAFFGFMFFIYLIYQKNNYIRLFKEEALLISIIFTGILVSQISNMSIMYGGIMEIIGIILCFIEGFLYTEKYIVPRLTAKSKSINN